MVYASHYGGRSEYNRISQISILDLEKTDLGELVLSEIEKYKKHFEIHQKQVSVDIETNKKVKCDKTLIALVIDNFLSNAVKHMACILSNRPVFPKLCHKPIETAGSFKPLLPRRL